MKKLLTFALVAMLSLTSVAEEFQVPSQEVQNQCLTSLVEAFDPAFDSLMTYLKTNSAGDKSYKELYDDMLQSRMPEVHYLLLVTHVKWSRLANAVAGYTCALTGGDMEAEYIVADNLPAHIKEFFDIYSRYFTEDAKKLTARGAVDVYIRSLKGFQVAFDAYIAKTYPQLAE
jgi:hypothetical protein